MTLPDSTMLSQLAASPFFIASLVLGALGVILVLAAVAALLHVRLLRFAFRMLAGLLLLALGALSGALSLGIQGYHALTREDVAAHVSIRPAGPQRFTAVVRYADGRETAYALAGDEVYVDAHILKWKPLVNILGLHTSYELDRISGRYHVIEQERAAPRTLYALSPERPVDLFGLRRRYEFLAPLLDADYGSASFVPASNPAEFELRVSTTGLLFREAGAVK
jgi:hypothetical protein